MRQLAKFTTKPVIVAEIGSSPDGGDKAAWVRDGYPAVYTAYQLTPAEIQTFLNRKLESGLTRKEVSDKLDVLTIRVDPRGRTWSRWC